MPHQQKTKKTTSKTENHYMLGDLRQRLLIYATAFTGDINLAEDLVQETYLQYLRGSKPKGSTEAWLKGILKGLLRNQRRRKKTLSLDPEHFDQVTAMVDRWHTASASSESLSALEQCLAALPQRQQYVLKMHYTDGYSCEEIARTCGQTKSAIKILLFRLRKGLKACIEERLSRSHFHEEA